MKQCMFVSNYNASQLDFAAEYSGKILPLRSVAKSKDELLKNKAKVQVFEDRVDDWGNFVSKRKSSLLICNRRAATNEIHNNGGRKPECRFNDVRIV